MNPIKITSIPIYPATHVRSTKGDRWLFAVTDEYLIAYDAKIEEQTGKLGGNWRRKRQLDKYNAYKEELRWWVVQNGFKMPTGYFAIWFHVAMPGSWRPKKVALMEGKIHESTPDFDNLLKAFFDSIMPRKSKTTGEKGSDDRKIHCCAPFKVWAKPENARIDIVQYDTGEYVDCFKYDPLSLERTGPII